MIPQTQIFIPVILFLVKKVVKTGYYGNEDLSLAWDRVKVCQMTLFYTANKLLETACTSTF